MRFRRRQVTEWYATQNLGQGMSFRPTRRALGLILTLSTATASATDLRGRVSFSGIAIPGATVTVTQGTKVASTLTDAQGFYFIAGLADGPATLKVQLFGFVPLEQTITVAAGATPASLQLSMLPLEAMLAQAKTVQTLPGAAPPAMQARTAKDKPAEEPAPEAQHRAEAAEDGLLINGSQSNAATSQYTLDPAFGNRRAGSKSLYTGGFAIHEGNAVLDARPYSLTGLQLAKAQFNQFTGVATLGGPLRIPHLLPRGPYFNVAYEWTRDSNQDTLTGLVPTAAERLGDLSGLLDPQGQPLIVIDPATGLPFPGPLPVSPQAQALLSLYPLSNLDGNTSYNYQTAVLNHTHADALQSRLNKSIGRRDQFYGAFAFQRVRSDNTSLFGFRDTTQTLGIDTNVHWSHLWHHQFYVDLGFEFSRLRTHVRPNFAAQQNVSGNAGILGNSQDPADWGPPSLAFSSGIASLTDGVSAFDRTRTDGLNVSVNWNRGRHNFKFGGDLRRQEFNLLSQQNPRGTFTFTGAATAGTPGLIAPTQTRGSDLADFLLGTPDTSALAFGNPDKYLRETTSDLFFTDDWRPRPDLTINAGLRWEYGAPITELFGRLVNLDVAPGFSAVSPVLASSPKGPLTGQPYPNSLIRPDKGGIEPRIGLSWRPIPASTLVIRSGYGIYRDTSIYLSSARQMSQQSPLSKSLSMQNSAACPLTLANGFYPCDTTTLDPFGVDPNLRVGYAQIWQLSAQRDLPGALVVIASYLGTKGTHGEQEFLPNTYPIGALYPTPASPNGFLYRGSGGNSIREAGSLQVRRRLRSGFTATALYTISKSIDNDSELGGQGHVTTSAAGETAPGASPTIAQNWLDLRAERSLSSFDQRHLLSLNVQYSSGVGLHGGTLFGGWRGRLLKDWTVTNQLNVGSGRPETPIFLAAVPGTGVTGSIRPNRTGAPIYRNSGGYFLNADAYAAPTAGQWGNAGRNSITGPGQLSLDTSLARTLRLRDPFNLDLRIDSTNLLNHAVFTTWSSTINSATFGLPLATNPMRTLQITLRLRF